MLEELFAKPVGFFLIVMAIILITPLISERLRLPGIIGIIIGGMLIGPHGFGLLEDNDRIQFLSTIGLVYLMFSAGLEVDINQFMKVRARALVFGLITFIFPQLMGMGLGYILGLDWLGMILLGSAFASHTLIAFPILTKLGVTRNEAIAVTTGATVLTDIGAFIVLAVVLGADKGGLSFGYFAQLFVMLALFTAVIIFGLPRFGKFVFQKLSGRAVEFQFVIVVLFVAAFFAEVIGVHEVVGAFLAGLAVNSMLPRHSPVAGHVLFIGESFFIPVFLLYSGLITDPLTFLKSPQTIVVAIGVTIVAYLSKLIAAWITAKIYKYTKSEFWTVYGLSHAQAAVTIPTLVIGLETGLFDSTLFNAAILMILLTSITSPLIVQRFAPDLQTASADDEQTPLFGRVLVPVSEANSGELVALASLLARSSKGKVLAVSVAQATGPNESNSLMLHKELLGKVSASLHDPEAELELIPRLAATHAQGILHTANEENASLIVMGWRGKRTFRESVLGSVLDEVIWGSDTPVVAGKLSLPLNSMRRVIFIVPAKAVPPIALRRMLEANLAVAKALNVPLLVRADKSYVQTLEALFVAISPEQEYKLEVLKDQLKPEKLEHEAVSDFIILPGFGSRKRVQDTLGNIPEQIAQHFDGNLVILHFDK
ncbi:MAG: cation:proton antiporter [Anaerolineales bacterium]|jgi:Kef-type K+ transport system membrane component KefB/nucleotide-binding universal stress UspA family protein|uniref:cation:proton antiporter n=1 Tax=Candidatus Villigracilis vicinus TaxID=3140679 RepID=UPI0031355C49|nr:cation:proton antiporter [Anaerolineales bacterium]MBK9782548.1 cation:proton antiporter [Anaerolineales bacterium]